MLLYFNDQAVGNIVVVVDIRVPRCKSPAALLTPVPLLLEANAYRHPAPRRVVDLHRCPPVAVELGADYAALPTGLNLASRLGLLRVENDPIEPFLATSDLDAVQCRDVAMRAHEKTLELFNSTQN